MSLAPIWVGVFRVRPRACAVAAAMTIRATKCRACGRPGSLSGSSIGVLVRSTCVRRLLPLARIVRLGPASQRLGDAVGLVGPDVVRGDQLGEDPQAHQLRADAQAD